MDGLFIEEVIKICPYYFELQPIFSERASIHPKALSTDNLNSDDEEDLEEWEDDDSGDDVLLGSLGPYMGDNDGSDDDGGGKLSPDG